MRYPEYSTGFSCRHFSSLPLFVAMLVLVRAFFGLWSKANALLLCSGNALRLSLSNKISFRLRHIREQLKNNISDQRSGQIPSLSGIQQRHVQHYDGCLFFFGDNPPLLNDLLIIASEPVNTLDYQNIIAFQLSDQFSVLWAIEVFTRLLVNKNADLINSELSHCDELAIFILLTG